MSKIDTVNATVRPDLMLLPDFARVLIVDDQSFDRRRLGRLIATFDLGTHGVEVGGLDAMDTALKAGTFDLILLGSALPNTTAWQAVDKVRRSAQNRHAAVIMVACTMQDAQMVDALKRGCSDCITEHDLASGAFERVALNAMRTAQLARALDAERGKRRHIEHVLKHFSTDCAREIKPAVAPLLQLLWDMQDRTGGFDSGSGQPTDEACMRLWDFLNDLHHYDAANVRTELRADPARQMHLSHPDPDRTAMAGTRNALSARLRDPFPVVSDRVVAERSHSTPPRKVFWRPDR